MLVVEKLQNFVAELSQANGLWRFKIIFFLVNRARLNHGVSDGTARRQEVSSGQGLLKSADAQRPRVTRVVNCS